jgi:hypothetical protein
VVDKAAFIVCGELVVFVANAEITIPALWNGVV